MVAAGDGNVQGTMPVPPCEPERTSEGSNPTAALLCKLDIEDDDASPERKFEEKLSNIAEHPHLMMIWSPISGSGMPKYTIGCKKLAEISPTVLMEATDSLVKVLHYAGFGVIKVASKLRGR